jgi:ribonuclease VapC
VIVVDTSALMAILLREGDADRFLPVIHRAVRPRISVASVVEAVLVVTGRKAADGSPQIRAFLLASGIAVEPVTVDQGWLAAEAFNRFGRGRHPARLNFGDCLAYALARDLDLPLLYRGNDFAHTDITPALPA